MIRAGTFVGLMLLFPCPWFMFGVGGLLPLPVIVAYGAAAGRDARAPRRLSIDRTKAQLTEPPFSPRPGPHRGRSHRARRPRSWRRPQARASRRKIVKAEAALLDRSRDLRPIPVDTPILIHLGIPLDPLDPDSDEPSPLLYGARPSDLWTQTEIISYRERRKHFYAELGVTEAQVHVNRRTRDERRRGQPDMRRTQSKTETKSGSPMRRSSKLCSDCRGTGYLTILRTCPECLGAELFDKNHPSCSRCGGAGDIPITRPCWLCGSTGRIPIAGDDDSLG